MILFIGILMIAIPLFLILQYGLEMASDFMAFVLFCVMLIGAIVVGAQIANAIYDEDIYCDRPTVVIDGETYISVGCLEQSERVKITEQ